MIIRVAKNSSNNYVIISKGFINNEKLSFKAKGLLTYLLSLPNDWKIYEKELMKHSTDGRDSVRSAIKELIDNGYIKRERKRNEKGELKEYSYTVYERANTEDSTYVGFSNIGKTNIGKTNIGKTDTTNNNLTNNNLTNNDLTNYLLDKEIYKENSKGEQQNEIALETKDIVSKELEAEFETILEKYPKKQILRLTKMLTDDYQKSQSTINKNVKENNISIKNKSNNIHIVRQVIDYMNNIRELENIESKEKELANNFSFRANSKTNINIIEARLNEGYVLSDFKDVIYNCYLKFVLNEFVGSNGKSSIQYYNPSTIFTSAKMEKYKNEYNNKINV